MKNGGLGLREVVGEDVEKQSRREMIADVLYMMVFVMRKDLCTTRGNGLR